MSDTAKLNVSAEYPTGSVMKKTPNPPPIAPLKQGPDLATIVAGICIAQVFVLVVGAVFSYLHDFVSYSYWWVVFSILELMYTLTLGGVTWFITRKGRKSKSTIEINNPTTIIQP